ncbi:hypothetical protein HPP92_009859 [Vanilla planifolia]|uniref:30S ribosomal protein S20, chloroplastic n=1 Tax=Vanilla planifolia TaxID=51239 RepID=A0A835V529_VANPL|nr:hypothetical protein HPP92_009859 [Vanilla planifolia]
MDAIAIASCLSLTCIQKPLTVSTSRARLCGGGNVFHCRIQPFKSLSFSASLSSVALLTGEAPFGALQKPKITRRSVVCEAVPKKADSAAKRARQNEKRRIYHKAKKSEVRTG